MNPGMIVAVSRRAAVLVVLALVLAPSALAATNGPVFGLRALGNPKLGYFVYPLAPGATKSGAIIVSNTGNGAGTVKLYSADATTGRTTGTVYVTDHKASATGAWVKLAQSSLFLAPGRHATVPFTVRVPAGAKPGQWVAGIVAETTQAAQGPKATHKANVRIRIRNLTIVAVQVDVPGPAAVSFTIGSVTTGGQHGFQQVLVGFSNNGNQLRKPKGTVTILDSGGKVVESLPYAMDTFLPHTSIDYPLLLKKALPPGDYRAIVRIAAPGANAGSAEQAANGTRSFSVSKQDVTQVFTSSQPTQVPPTGVTSASSSSSPPWALIAAAAVGALLLVLLLFQLARRRRAKPVARAPRSASAGLAPEAPLAAAPVPVPVSPPPAAPEPVAPGPVPVSKRPEPALAAPRPSPAEPAPPLVQPAPPIAAPVSSACDPYHFWEVAYDRGQLGSDGVWRFPHRCRQCGLELVAADIGDASAQANALRSTG